jgi:colanic acid biosynthesis glycosyl transferase WcaI
MRRVWVVSELYYPETASTGYILTGIAEGLAANSPVRVICGQPSYVAKGTRASKRESRNGVEIERCWGTTWDKNVLWKRVVNALTISCSMFLAMLVRLRRGDRVLAVTNPPALPILAALACAVRRAKCVLLVHDKFPEALVAVGLLKSHSLFAGALDRCMRRVYRRSASIVTLGRDMQALVQSQAGGDPRRVVVIPNWADTDAVRPQPRSENRLLREHGLLDKFVVQCAGNIGRMQDIELLVKCAETLRDHPEIHFLFVGSGAKKAWLDRVVQEPRHENITALPAFSREESSEVFNSCDVAVNALIPEMLGVSVPSRTYNVLAAGKPIIAAADPDSELARLIREEDIGWVVAPGDAPGMARAILEASGQPDALAAMGRRARSAAETKYAFPTIISAFVQVMENDAGVVK